MMVLVVFSFGGSKFGSAARSRSELGFARRSRIGDHVPNICKPGDVTHQSFEAEAESCVRGRAVAPQVEIPVVGRGIETVLPHA